MKKLTIKAGRPHPDQLFIKLVEETDDDNYFFEIFENIADAANRDRLGVYKLKEVKTVKKTTTTRLV